MYAAGIFAEIGDINCFPSEAQIARLAGLAWIRHQSGNFEADDTTGQAIQRISEILSCGGSRFAATTQSRIYSILPKKVCRSNEISAQESVSINSP